MNFVLNKVLFTTYAIVYTFGTIYNDAGRNDT